MNAATVVRHLRTIDTFAQLQVRAAVLRPSKAELGTWLAGRLHGLGPTYIKIGQFVSSRQDIFGREFSEPFNSLRDNVPPIPASEVAEILRLNCDMSAFGHIDLEPMATASIGQVHAAVLRDGGMRVVLKIKRPGVGAVIREDLAFISMVLDAVTRLNGASQESYEGAVSFMNDFEAYLLQEVDFRKEAANMERFAAQHGSDRDVLVPATVPALCTDAMIVMERIDSRGIDLYTGSAAARRRTANRVMDLFISQLVNKGAVHGDPHPGNVGIDVQGRVVLYDFGNVIYISADERLRMKEMIYQLLVGNNRGVSDTLKKLGVRVLDEAALDAYIDLYRDYMRTIDVKSMQRIVTTSDIIPLQLTDKFVRLIRVYGMLEGSCKAICPEFNYFDLLDNYIDDLFFDDEFVTYKVSEDVRSLMSRAAQPYPSASSSPPAKREKRGGNVEGLGAALMAMYVITHW